MTALLSQHKEERGELRLRQEIDQQIEPWREREESLLPKDRYLLDINHDDFESSQGEKRSIGCWLANWAARKACVLATDTD